MNRKNVNPMLMMAVLLILLRMVRGNMFSLSSLLDKLLLLPAIIIGLSVHEFAHAFVSDRLGDPLPRAQGRVTLNPLRHIDPIGFVMLLLCGFGWGVPVHIDPRYYKKRRRDEALVAVAGVTMNFITAVAFCFIFRFVSPLLSAGRGIGGIIGMMIIYTVMTNIVLMVFNLIPCPPLDGFNIITQIFNLRKYGWYQKAMQYGYFILLLFIILGGADLILSPVVSVIYNGIMNLICY